MRSHFLGVVLTLPLAASAGATDVEPGYTESALSFAPPVLAVSATLSDGNVLTFDGLTMERHSSGGVLLQTYTTLPGFVFPSFLTVAPNEAFAVAGESTNGEIFRIDLASGVVTSLATLELNYDAVIDSAGDVFVSAAATAFGTNDLYRIDIPTTTVDLLAQVPGFSGPVALEPDGDLLFGLADTPDRIIRYTALQLVGGVVLGEGDGALVSSGWDGLSDMVVDAETGEIFVVENDYVDFLDPSTIHRVRPTKNFSPVVATATGGATLGGLQLETTAADPEVFAEFQPSTGGVLRFSSTDFVAVSGRAELRPVRPTSSVSGPGVGGVGRVDYVVEGAVPNGVVWVFYGASSLFDPDETAIHFGAPTPPLFWGLDSATQRYIPFLFPTDATGTAAFSFYNLGNLTGLLALQSPIADANATLKGSAPGCTL